MKHPNKKIRDRLKRGFVIHMVQKKWAVAHKCAYDKEPSFIELGEKWIKI